MKVAIFITILGLCAVAWTLPTLNEMEESFNANAFDDISTEDHGARYTRATCDLLSVSTPWGSLNHAACAAHCLAMQRGFRGGRCRDGICHCRK